MVNCINSLTSEEIILKRKHILEKTEKHRKDFVKKQKWCKRKKGML
jgi:hypothetical protein